jgi:DNA-binding NtrC family response regulator
MAARGTGLAHDLNPLPVGGDWQAIARRVAPTTCPVLLTGETGSGKGFAARWIHEHSARSQRPFIPVNCGAIPETLIDSHLFGHVRGAFSGAERDHPGLVGAADGGTLLLDEIADLPLTAQSRLLRLLEEREAQPVGCPRPLKVDVRIIAATSADLRGRVENGQFRADLLFRLDVVRLCLPPLRERRHEIPGLVAMFNLEFARLYQQPHLQFSREALRLMHMHDWPGNVRELRTLLERLHVLCGREARKEGAGTADHDVRVITMADLVEFGRMTGPEKIDQGRAVKRLQHLRFDAVNQALSACDGNMSQAATTLGVHRSTLYRWLTSHRRLTA